MSFDFYSISLYIQRILDVFKAKYIKDLNTVKICIYSKDDQSVKLGGNYQKPEGQVLKSL